MESRTAGRNDPNPSHYRDEIIDVAAEAFANHGFEGTSMNDIGLKLGVSKQALYHHFRNKRMLYLEVSRAASRQLCFHTEQRLDHNSPVQDRLITFLTSYAEFFETNNALCRASFFSFEKARSTREWHEVVKWRERYENILYSMIKEGVRSGVFNVADSKLAAIGILSTLSNFPRWFSLTGKLSAKQVATFMGKMFLNGLITR